MRIAVLSDIHANLQALTAVIRDCDQQGIEEFWLLGDYVDYGASVLETVSLLSSLKAKYVLSGNHDACLFNPHVRISSTPHGIAAHEYTKQMINDNPPVEEWLKSAPGGPMLKVAGMKTLLVHGTPSDPYWGTFTPEGDIEAMFAQMKGLDVEVMLVGHSHLGFMLKRSGRTIINPGSVGQPRDGCPDAAYVILDSGTVTFCRVPYDVEAAADEIKKAGLPEYLWQRLYKGV